MIGLLNLPPLPYCIFELLRFRKNDVSLSTGEIYGPAESTEVIVFDVQPTRFSYEFTGKTGLNAGLGDDNYTLVRGGEAPRKIVLQGTFGNRLISRGGVTRDGFERMQQFKKMARKSVSINDSFPSNLPDAFQYIYGMNFYDFNERYWEAVNLDSFSIEKDAVSNSIIPNYTIRMMGLGKLIDAVPKDPFLRNLKLAIKIQEEFDQINEGIIELLQNELSIIPEILGNVEAIQIATGAAAQMTGQYAQITSGIPGSQLLPLGQLAGLLGRVSSFASLLDN